MNEFILWNHPAPEHLILYQTTSSINGELRVIRVPGGYLYTQWRLQYPKDWEPFATTFVPLRDES